MTANEAMGANNRMERVRRIRPPDRPSRPAKVTPLLSGGLLLLVAFLLVPATAASARAGGPGEEDSGSAGELLDLPLEELMNVRVTSAAKKAQAVDDVAAAVYVLTSEQLRRSGATSIPDALRLVPGLHVASIDASKWAVSARGFNDRFANKMLVLVDGRSIYTRLFSGVYWEMVDIPFELVDRIEVVRGPGATIWGANAVNGVINIITKKATAVPGTMVGFGVGTSQRASFTGISSRRLGANAGFRAYGLYADHAPGYSGAQNVDDSWTTGHLGFRLDWERSPREELTAIGEIGRQSISNESRLPSLNPPYLRGHHSSDPFGDQSFLVRYSRRYREQGELTLQSYLQGSSIDVSGYLAQQSRTYDLEIVNRLGLGRSHETMTGLEIQTTWDHVDSTMIASLDPLQSTTTLLSAFIQHEWRPWSGRVIGTIGSKFEHHPLTGWETQPNLRLLFHPVAGQTIWGAVSRAVRSPARVDESLSYLVAVVPPDPRSPDAPATLVTVEGSEQFRAEEVRAVDAGYRLSATRRLQLDLTGFVYNYRDLRSDRMGAPQVAIINGSSFLKIPVHLGNDDAGRSYGYEVSAGWRHHRTWGLTATYAFLHMETWPTDDGPSLALAGSIKPDPRQALTLRWEWDPSRRTDVDIQWRYVDKVPSPAAPAYLTADLRLGRRWSRGIRTDLTARNLFAGRHREFIQDFVVTVPTAVEPSVGLLVEWRP